MEGRKIVIGKCLGMFGSRFVHTDHCSDLRVVSAMNYPFTSRSQAV